MDMHFEPLNCRRAIGKSHGNKINRNLLDMEEAPLDRRLKVVIVANPITDKTSLPSRFVDGIWDIIDYPNCVLCLSFAF